MALARRKEREIVFALLFAARFQEGEDDEALLATLLEECDEEGAGESDYIRSTFLGARAFAPQAGELIASAAVGWRPERLSRTVATILELALYEMRQNEEVPQKIAINEAVELAKKFGEDGAGKFVNGVLGKLADPA